MQERTPIADVRVNAAFDGLLIVPRGSDQRLLKNTLSASPPGIGMKRRLEGIEVTDLTGIVKLLDLNPSYLAWQTDALRFAQNRRLGTINPEGIREAIGRLKAGGSPAAKQATRDLSGRDVLDGHQLLNVALMTVPAGNGLCVFDEQGAGKSVTFIFAFDLLVQRDEVDIALIVAPKSMVPEWPKDIQRFKGDIYETEILSGNREAKLRVLRNGADIFVTNFETIVSLEAEIRSHLQRFNGRAVIVVDESFFIKNGEAKRTQALRRLREWCRRAYVLCGTPAPNAPHDLIEQFNFVDFGTTFSGINIPEDHDLARPVIQAAIEAAGTYVRHLKSDVLPDLPGKIFHRVNIRLAPQQREIYASILNELVAELERTTDIEFKRRISSFLAKRIALLQACSNPVSLVNSYTETPSKLLALDSLLEEMIARRREKVVLWSFFTQSIEWIADRYRRFNPVRYDGTITSIEQRRAAVQNFQEDDSTMLFIGNPAAAGAGLTLHRSKYAIYESMSNQAAHYLQSLDRIHRRGQAREVEYVVLLSDGTIESQEFDRLQGKERSAQILLGDQISPPLTREVMLEELQLAVINLEEQKQ